MGMLKDTRNLTSIMAMEIYGYSQKIFQRQQQMLNTIILI